MSIHQGRDSASSPLYVDEEKDSIEREVTGAVVHRPRPIPKLFYFILAFFSIIFMFLLAISAIQSEGSPHLATTQTCLSPSIRQEWRTYTTEQKRAYTSAVLCLTTRPSVLGLSQSLYDDFPYTHVRVGDPTHDTPYFLPWHRYFVHIYETALREQCGYTGHMPFWDWTLDWQDVRLSPIWSDDDGFGGDGNETLPGSIGRGRCVTDGPFANMQIQNANMSSHPHCLSRGFTDDEKIANWSSQLDPQNVGRISNIPSYEQFFDELENGPHMAIPFSVRGEFFYFTSPNDPVFFLHHAQLDKLWLQWQQEFPTIDQHAWNNETAATGTGLQKLLDMGGLAPAVQVSEVMNTQNSLLCYRYS